MEDYTILGRIGEGAHGVVMKARHRKSGTVVALKKVLLKRLEDGLPETALREIKALQVLDSDYVVKLHDVFAQGLGFVLVFEYMLSDLSEMIHNIESPLQENQVKSYMEMLLKGMTYLHAQNIMHRDLKPANLLLSSKGRLKIADLGLSRVFANDPGQTRRAQYSHQVATRWYRAPELLYGSRTYTEAVDLWSVGCIFGELLNNSPIFPGENDIDQLGIVIKILGSPNENIWPGVKELPDFSKITFPDTEPVRLEEIVPDAPPEAVDLFKQFVKYDSRKRISAQDALAHVYFSSQPLAAELADMPRPREKLSSGGHHKSSHQEMQAEASFNEMFADLLELASK